MISIGYVVIAGGVRLRHRAKKLNSGTSGSTSSRLGVAVALGLAIMVAPGCGTSRVAPSPEEVSLSWDSPKMREIKAEWETLHETYRKHPEKIPGDCGKTKYGNLLEMCDSLLRERLSYEELRGLTSSCGTLPIRDADRDPFGNEVLAFMVREFVASGDRDTLVRLLSTRCVRRASSIWRTTLEYYLASEGDRTLRVRLVRLRDPILVLGEAHAKCTIPEVRTEIAFAVRRGFGAMGITGKDDAEFVRNAMQWYEQRKGHVTANWGYLMQHLCVDTFWSGPEEYDKEMSLRDRREPLFRENEPASARGRLGLPFPMLPIWLLHAGMAAALTAPIALLGRKRVHWRKWELLAFVLPFVVWMLLMASDLACSRKTAWNYPEGLCFAPAIPLAAIVRVAVGSRRGGQWWAAGLLIALCGVAAAVFFLVPPWRGGVLL